MKKTINYNKFNVSIAFNIVEGELVSGVDNYDAVRYLKGIFTNKERFKSRFIDVIRNVKKERSEFECDDLLDSFVKIYDEVKPFTYLEAFKLENRDFQARVFGSINIGEMIENLGHERIATDGKKVKHKKFDVEGNPLGDEEYDNIYEVHKVDGKKLGTDDLYVLKCWCTSTNKEHWIWIDGAFKDKPLEAVASTFRIHANLIPHIKEIKRQGDVLLVELDEDVTPSGEIVSLTADQYFSLLTCQS